MAQKSTIFKPYRSLLNCYLLLNFVLRIVLLYHPITNSNFSFSEYFRIFVIGALNDFSVFTIAFFFFWLYFIFISNSKYNKPWGIIISILLISIWGYVTFGNTIFDEYGGVLPTIAITFISIKTIMYLLCLIFPIQRIHIRQVNYFFVLFLFVLIMVQNTLSEFFFWNEFGVRYNFIAVDYLVYTNEVIGNIMESYPVIPLFIGVGTITIILSIYVFKKTAYVLNKPAPFRAKISQTFGFVLLTILSLFLIPKLNKQVENNVFTAELKANGIFKFYSAFMNSELDFFQFYQTVDKSTMLSTIKKYYPEYNEQQPSLLHQIKNDTIEQKKNVVLITMESFSADFLSYYGNTSNLTPFLDSLATKSIFFTQLYATGNRTVRGLEAVTMGILPSPGESIIKRRDNKNKFTTGWIFKQKGYQVKYLYGGNAEFDNMNDFFKGNGYDIVDKSSFKPEEISFQNIWGVCDEDMAKKAIKIMNSEYKEGKPFFNHIMTVSNHRPFTYPAGAINDSDIIGDGRAQGVRYTDYSIKKFFEYAQKEAWYNNTIFVIIADHCASSAGKTELPLDKYRIPGMIFAPQGIKPHNYNQLMSQIDIMPTLFGLLNFNYNSKFFGQDVLKSSYIPRAFIATYQDLGFISDNQLTIINANKQVKQYTYDNPSSNQNTIIPLQEVKSINRKHLNETISFYQFTAQQLKNKAYDK